MDHKHFLQFFIPIIRCSNIIIREKNVFDPSTILRYPNLNMRISNYGVQNAYVPRLWMSLLSDMIDCPMACNNISTCLDIPGSFQCTCPVGYTGSGLATDSCLGEFGRTSNTNTAIDSSYCLGITVQYLWAYVFLYIMDRSVKSYCP